MLSDLLLTILLKNKEMRLPSVWSKRKADEIMDSSAV